VWNTLFYNNFKRKFIIGDRLHWCWRNTKKTSQTFRLKYFQIVVETFPITCISIFRVESVKNTLFYNNYKKKLSTCDKLHWCWRNTKKTYKTSSLKYLQIVVETFSITYNGIFHFESVKNTLFYNNYKKKLSSWVMLHWCWRNTKRKYKTSSLKYFQIVVETFPVTCISIFRIESV
jgi:hypothetical protein